MIQKSHRRDHLQPFTDFHLGEYLKPLHAIICPDIINADNVSRIHQLVDPLPGEISTFFGLECPMEAGRTDADFLFCSTRSEGHSAMIAGAHPRVTLAEQFQTSPAWSIVARFCSAWEDSTTRLHDGIHNIWLEFDVGNTAPPWQPSLFFGIDHDHSPSKHEVCDLVLEALTHIDNAATSTTRAEKLKSVINQLPPSAELFQVGVMLSRKMPAIRVCIRGIAAEAVCSFLKKVGYGGDLDEISATLKQLEGTFTKVDIDLDIGESIGSKAGLEFSFESDDSRLELVDVFLRKCLDLNLTDDAKASALLNFNGLIHSRTNPEAWPKRLNQQLALLGEDQVSVLAFWLHHVKIDFQSPTQPSAKAYLAIEPGRLKTTDLVKLVKQS